MMGCWSWSPCLITANWAHLWWGQLAPAGFCPQSCVSHQLAPGEVCHTCSFSSGGGEWREGGCKDPARLSLLGWVRYLNSFPENYLGQRRAACEPRFFLFLICDRWMREAGTGTQTKAFWLQLLPGKEEELPVKQGKGAGSQGKFPVLTFVQDRLPGGDLRGWGRALGPSG